MYFNGSLAGSSDLCLQPTGLGWAEVTGTCGSGVGMKSFTVWPGPLPSSWLYASTSVCFAGNWTLHITHHNFFSWNHCFQHYLEYKHTAEKPTIREKNIVYFGLTKLRNIVLIYCLIKMEEWFLVYYCCCCYHLKWNGKRWLVGRGRFYVARASISSSYGFGQIRTEK